MKKTLITSVVLTTIAMVAIVYSGTMSSRPTSPAEVLFGRAKPLKTMTAFKSQQELKDFFIKLAEKQKRVADGRDLMKSESANASSAPSIALDGVSTGKADESITNTQHAGVDEGGIVKVHGDHLVILRRG
ncbi:MAG: hypothetical protein ABJB34_04310, partial [Acidobacteriota bacterium]